MTIDDFAAATLRIVHRDGVEGHLPTACYPALRRVVVLEGYPDPIVPAEVVRKWAAGVEGGEHDHLVAYRTGKYRIQIELIAGPGSDSRLLDFAP